MEQGRDLTFLKDVFPQTDAPRPIRYPISEAILLVHNALGSGRLKEAPVFFRSIGTAAAAQNQSNAVPAGKVWIIPFACAEHDAAAGRQLRLSIVGPDGTTLINVASSAGAVASGIKVPTTRTLYLPPLCRITCEADGMLAGEHPILALLYWEVPVGELLDIP